MQRQSEKSPRAESATTLIKVLIYADTTNALARLATIVRSAPSLELVAAVGDPEILAEQLERLETAEPVVVIEHVAAFRANDSRSQELGDERAARIILTNGNGIGAAVEAIKESDSEILGVLPTSAGEKEIIAAIEGAGAGLIVVHPDVFDELRAAENRRGRLPAEDSSDELAESGEKQLSPRESEVLNLLADGLANKEIAWRLKISEHTVKFHITSLFNKLSVSTRAEAVAVGARRGLIIL
jgi:NarL family two-component system response regulator YdfI